MSKNILNPPPPRNKILDRPLYIHYLLYVGKDPLYSNNLLTCPILHISYVCRIVLLAFNKNCNTCHLIQNYRTHRMQLSADSELRETAELMAGIMTASDRASRHVITAYHHRIIRTDGHTDQQTSINGYLRLFLPILAHFGTIHSSGRASYYWRAPTVEAATLHVQLPWKQDNCIQLSLCTHNFCDRRRPLRNS